mmetsp:Transcript_21040/g.34800  ORF Transcript_21040/g.34800 Transcript_21040/m.34800 type:complete len:184 (+) Transcript_21040:586-1137(+)
MLSAATSSKISSKRGTAKKTPTLSTTASSDVSRKKKASTSIEKEQLMVDIAKIMWRMNTSTQYIPYLSAFTNLASYFVEATTYRSGTSWEFKEFYDEHHTDFLEYYTNSPKEAEAGDKPGDLQLRQLEYWTTDYVLSIDPDPQGKWEVLLKWAEIANCDEVFPFFVATQSLERIKDKKWNAAH